MKQTAFRKDYAFLSVVSPVAFLTHVRSGKQKKSG
jgi:hypothetical protein